MLAQLAILRPLCLARVFVCVYQRLGLADQFFRICARKLGIWLIEIRGGPSGRLRRRCRIEQRRSEVLLNRLGPSKSGQVLIQERSEVLTTVKPGRHELTTLLERLIVGGVSYISRLLILPHKSLINSAYRLV